MTYIPSLDSDNTIIDASPSPSPCQLAASSRFPLRDLSSGHCQVTALLNFNQSHYPCTSTHSRINDGEKTVHDLPGEILGHIFNLATSRSPTGSACDEHSYSYLLPNQLNDTECPRNVMLVCKHWHSVARSEVSIWTHLSSAKLLGPLPSASSMRYWLSLSRGAELRLCLREGQNPTTDAGIHTFTMIRLFTSQEHRLRSLEMHLSSRGLWTLVRLISNSFTSNRDLTILDELQIYAYPNVKMKDFNSLYDAAKHLKSFRHLTLSHAKSRRHFAIQPTFVLPWHWYETMDLRTQISMEDAIQVIGACTSATSIRLAEISETDDATNNTQTAGNASRRTSAVISLPCLAHLTLNGAIHPIELLQNFSFPNLTTLTISSERPTPLGYRPLESLLEAQDCDRPKLRKVHIQNLYRSLSGGLPNFIHATRGLAAVKDVSISYLVPTIHHMRDLSQLPSLQAEYDSNGSPTSNTLPVPRLMVWLETEKADIKPLDVHVGWMSNTDGYTVVAQCVQDGYLKYLPHRLSI